jgi:hypothetical protein
VKLPKDTRTLGNTGTKVNPNTDVWRQSGTIGWVAQRSPGEFNNVIQVEMDWSFDGRDKIVQLGTDEFSHDNGSTFVIVFDKQWRPTNYQITAENSEELPPEVQTVLQELQTGVFREPEL